MFFLKAFINFFFVPVIALAAGSRTEIEKMKPAFSLFIRYCILVCLNIPLTKVLTIPAEKFLEREIPADSGYYTVFAILAALVLGCIVRFVSRGRKA